MNRKERKAQLEIIRENFDVLKEPLKLSQKKKEEYLQKGLAPLQKKLADRLLVHTTILLIKQRSAKINWHRTFTPQKISKDDLSIFVRVLENQEALYKKLNLIGVQPENQWVKKKTIYPITTEWIFFVRNKIWTSKSLKQRKALIQQEIEKTQRLLKLTDESLSIESHQIDDFLHYGHNFCSAYLQQRELLHASLDTLEKRAATIGWNLRFEDRKHLSMMDVEVQAKILTQQEELMRPIQQYGFGIIPDWVKKELSFPLQKESLELLQEKCTFDNKWRTYIEETRTQINPSLQYAIPPTPNLITPENLPPILQALKSHKNDIRNTLWNAYSEVKSWFGDTHQTWTKKRIQLMNQMSMIAIPTGSYVYQQNRNISEALEIEIDQFYLSIIPCTQNLYQAVMNHNPSRYTGDNLPVQNVSWCDAILFCNRLSILEGLEPVYLLPDDFSNHKPKAIQVKQNNSANGYRLPTIHEWQYAAQADGDFIFSGGNRFDEIGWFHPNSKGKVQPVQQQKCNAWGLYDMSGNVYEWIWQTLLFQHAHNSTASINFTSPQDTSSLRYCVGGSYKSFPQYHDITSSLRNYSPTKRVDECGFRIARSIL